MTTSFRDDHYRSLVDNGSNYDEVIDMIIGLNSAATSRSKPNDNSFETPEEFACSSVHSCIRSVLFGNGGDWATTGGCIAVRLSNRKMNEDGSENPNFKKVVLAYNGPFVKPIV